MKEWFHGMTGLCRTPMEGGWGRDFWVQPQASGHLSPSASHGAPSPSPALSQEEEQGRSEG